MIINADSAQVYADLRVLSARPSVEDEAKAPHALYGFVDGATAFSSADWAKTVVDPITREERLPILVGGTGLYFRVLFDGIAELPPIPPAIREQWRAFAKSVPAPELHEELRKRDPVTASRLAVNDTQRITRALEVFETTNQSLSQIQAEQTKPLLNKDGWQLIVLDATRNMLAERIEQRFAKMMDDGALEEVRRLLARNLDAAAPVMKAIGVPELAAHLNGEIPLSEAVEQAIFATRRYAKRQETWFRNQMPSWQRMTPATVESFDFNP